MDKNFIEEELYKKIVENVLIATVDIVVLSRDLKKLLLFKRENNPAKGIYYTPGGRIYKGEEAIECAIRKTKEEIGIDISKDDLGFGGTIVEKWENSFFSEEIESSFMTMFFYFILDNEDNLKLDKQHSEYKWFNIEDETISPYVRKKVKYSLNKIEK
jgi:colanic acid biosynthesis protein WcaH